MKFTIYLVLLGCCITWSAVAQEQKSLQVDIPFGGNAWISESTTEPFGLIGPDGIRNWRSRETSFKLYFKSKEPMELEMSVLGGVRGGDATIAVVFGKERKEVVLSGEANKRYPVGTIHVEANTYQYVEIFAVSKSFSYFPDLRAIGLKGQGVENNITYVKDEFYWSRRGASVHLTYNVPEGIDSVEYFYSELLVPEGNDVLGSYFMANGFAEGYFGMQVNPTGKRRILFSVWSPYQTDKPEEIPEEYKIQLVKKGQDVVTKKFGNEGSGGQSYKLYNWQAGKRYQFLLKGVPAGPEHTVYTAYFKPELDQNWMLIASFSRPKTNTYLKRLHSFLENFIPSTGQFQRMALYQNQWLYTQKGQWLELTKARFTTDNTGMKQNRVDFKGGVRAASFYLQNCGFFNGTTPVGIELVRPETKRPPKIDFAKLD